MSTPSLSLSLFKIASDRRSLFSESPIQFYPVILLTRSHIVGMHDKTTHQDLQGDLMESSSFQATGSTSVVLVLRMGCWKQVLRAAHT